MTVSLPSREAYVVDVPDVREFDGVFNYNFFVVDESVNATSEVPTKLLSRPADVVDSDFLQYSSRRAPRFILMNFTPVRLSNVGNSVSDVDVKDDNSRENGRSIVSDNIDKIASEDEFASFNYVSVGFQDAELNDKIFTLVSGSVHQYLLDDADVDTNNSHAKIASALKEAMPGDIKSHFISRALTSPKQAYGSTYYVRNDAGGYSKLSDVDSRHGGRLSKVGRGVVERYNRFIDSIHNVMIHTQINSRLLHDIIDRTLRDPNAPYGNDLNTLHKTSKQIQKASRVKLNHKIDELDFKPAIPFINIKVNNALNLTKNVFEIVGYLIDKTEITPKGDSIQHPPIPIDNPNAHYAIDFNIKYGSTYVYTIRSVASFTVPATDIDTGDIATIQVLVSSKPSQRLKIDAAETVPPPPPADVNFTWDYERDKLVVHWTFPTNSQRDIKKFQIFRRESIEHPYELIKMYDFDDSYVRYEDVESPVQSLVEYVNSPVTWFIDDEFDRMKNSKFIYAIAAIDAHGLTSTYSAQFEVWFDPFKNKLQKRLVSHSGAPKPYPNMYLEADIFVDTIRTSGQNSKRMRLYFNPEHYVLSDNEHRLTKTFVSKQTGDYKLNIVNLDNQKSKVISILIDDQLKPQEQSAPTLKKVSGTKRLKIPG